MATIKVKFRPPSEPEGQGAVYFQIIHARKVCSVTTDYRLFAREWNGMQGIGKFPEAGPGRMEYVREVEHGIACGVRRFRRIVAGLEAEGGDYSAVDVREEFVRRSRAAQLFPYMERRIAELRSHGRWRTSETYRAAMNSFMRFRGGADVGIDSLSADMMEAYQGWLRMRGNVPNTISFYNRILRAVYNRARESGMTDGGESPFSRVYTGVDKTVKRALPIAQLRRIRALDLSGEPALDYARDIFMMSFYMRGMSFIDMAFLRK